MPLRRLTTKVILTFLSVLVVYGPYLSESYTLDLVLSTNNTLQDEPTWSISTSRGFATSEKTGDDTEYRPEHEDLIFVLFITELQEHRRREISKWFWQQW